MKKNRILWMGISGMGIFVLMHMILILTKAPNVTPKALIFGYVITATVTLVGVIIGVNKVNNPNSKSEDKRKS